jgi:hypothetical protein
MNIFVSKHALDRYRIHHATASNQEVLDAVKYGTEESYETAHVILGRNGLRRDESSKFIVAPDKQGMFVVSPEKNNYSTHCVVTYLRLQEYQSLFLDNDCGNQIASILNEKSQKLDGEARIEFLNSKSSKVKFHESVMNTFRMKQDEIKKLLVDLPKSSDAAGCVSFTVNDHELCAIEGKERIWVIWIKNAYDKSLNKKKKVVSNMYLSELEERYASIIKEKENSSKQNNPRSLNAYQEFP